MNDQQYFLATSLSCQLKAAQRELSAFWSSDGSTWGCGKKAWKVSGKTQKSNLRTSGYHSKPYEPECTIGWKKENVSVFFRYYRRYAFSQRRNDKWPVPGILFKEHTGINDTPEENFGGIPIHDHETCFYGCGSDHQECMVHIERYLKDSKGRMRSPPIRLLSGWIQPVSADSGMQTQLSFVPFKSPCGTRQQSVWT